MPIASQTRFHQSNGRWLLVVAFALVSSVACAENLYYTPASTTTATNKFGRFVYSSENWKTAAGEYKYPADGDVLICQGWNQMTANGTSGYNATHLDGLIYNGAFAAVSQGEFKMRPGGVGLVLTNGNSQTVNWYCGVGVYGSGELSLYVHSSCTWSFQRYFWQRDSGEITLVKRGAGKVQFADGSGYAGDERATWKNTRFEAGTFLWSILGTKGPTYNYPQMFPKNHVFTFADQGPGATFSIDKCDLELENFTLLEASPLALPNHTFTCNSTTNVSLKLIGTPGLNPMGFGGKLTEKVGFLWRPDSADNVFVFSNSVSTTKGELNVANGTVRLEKGASFTQLSKLTIASGAKFEVAKGAGASFCAGELVLADDEAVIKVDLAPLSFARATRGGVAVEDGVYTSSNCDWVKGSGYVLVNATLPVQDAWWTNDADHPKALADNVQTNWYGLHLSGESFALTAGDGSSVVLGAGGVDTVGAGAIYSIGWPLILNDAQLWQVAAGDTVSLTTDDLLLLGGKTWCVNNADSGVLRLDGAKALPNNMVVSNGWLEVRGDESLGGASGTTTFELYNSSGRKGKLRILPEEGKNEVSFHRNVTFHYQKCDEWGDFMTLPANCTVNFYGKMSTSSTGCEGKNYPCHWRYTCPSTTVVHWWGTMHAALNHHFPGGTHYVHSPLSGGDRFNVSKGVVVELLAANNSIGAATGDFQGKMYCRVPYALNAGSADRLLSFGGGTLDLCGGDQSLSLIHCTSDNNSTIYSEEPALMHLTRNKYVTDYNISCSNFVHWTGAAGFSMERTANTYPFVLKTTSSTTGTLQTVSGVLVMGPTGSWPNSTNVVVKGGTFTILPRTAAQGKPFGKQVNFHLNSAGKLDLPAGFVQKCATLTLNGEPVPEGTYGSTASRAVNKNDDYFTGEGILRVGQVGSLVILR